MKPVQPSVSFPNLEEETLKFWSEEQIFQKSLDQSQASKGEFVFYDGPPFATGLPHYGHLLAGTIKDVVGRYFSMKGYHVDRRFGWDCHGVPVEFEIQKTLELKGAKDIEDFGIDRFNEACREIVLRYTAEWEEFVTRSGRWVDFNRQYRTMDLEFMESIWWVFKTLWDRGLIYEGQKCVPYSWAMSTPLSNFEANLNYKTVQDPAVTVRVPIKSFSHEALSEGETVFLHLWTTTPWTLPSNMAVAVSGEMAYGIFKNQKTGEVFVISQDRANAVLGKKWKKEDKFELLGEVQGRELAGLSYEPLFDYFTDKAGEKAFKVYAEDFVTSEDGTGLVHLASFGEDDLGVFQREGIPVIDPVDADGNFTELVSDFSGENIKSSDSSIISHLKKQQKLVDHRTIEHSYPFCWRTNQPLIYRAISTWFVQVEEFKDKLQAHNQSINWVPGHLKDGRMGKWLEGARDWAISRNRYWGTPLPLWRCDDCGTIECFGSVGDLETASGREITDLHRHHIDDIKIPCKECSGNLERVPEVLDCWFESGSMPYAQAHYPFENKEKFEEGFPADFIAEGLDQTRGWFYTLLALSTALFDKPAFKNVIVNGILLAEDGKKMSKSLKNYPPPEKVMNEIGADAMRLYLLSSAACRGEELRFSEKGVQLVLRQTILPLWNAYNFFVTYALADNWETPKSLDEQSQVTNPLDRWILSKLGSLVEKVDDSMSNYLLYASVPPVIEFIEQLTNWYIRLNRRRFWSTDEDRSEDKNQAYQTLYGVLKVLPRVLAPLAPFVSEEIHRNLRSDGDKESVHLESFPTLGDLGLNEGDIDRDLEKAMELFEEVILLARSLRNDSGLKVRQPLSQLTVIYPEPEILKRLQELEAYIKDELNIKNLVWTTEEEEFVELTAKLNTKKLGKELGPKLGSGGMKDLRNLVEGMSGAEIRNLESGVPLEFQGLSLGIDDLIISRKVKEVEAGENSESLLGSSGRISVELVTSLSPQLIEEGLAREFVNRTQKARKDFDLHVSDRIELRCATNDSALKKALVGHEEYIKRETLAHSLELESEGTEPSFQWSEAEIEQSKLSIGIRTLS